MSTFRKYGGIGHAPTHNIVKSHISNNDNLGISHILGLQNTTIVCKSNMDVYGDASFAKNVDISGNLNVVSDTLLNKNLYVGGDASFAKNVDISGNLNVTGAIKGNLDISFNDLDINGNLYVGGDASFNQNVDISGNLNVTGTIKGNLDISFNDLNVSGNLSVGGDASFEKNLHVDGILTTNNDCVINGINVGTGGNSMNNSNSAFGTDALKNNTGSFNVGIGNSSLKENTSGSCNVGLGYLSLSTNTDGSNNIAIGGQNTLYNNTTGSNNVAIGSNSLTSITIGNENTALGNNSGQNVINSVTGGNYNTFLGANTDFDNGLNAYNNSTAVGYNATITESNQIVLGTASEYVYIPSTTATTGATSGALVVNGGVGINGNLVIGGGILEINSVSILDNTGVLFIHGGILLQNDASFNQNVDILGDLNVAGTIKGNLDISFNDLNVSGNLYVGGDASFNQNVDILGDLNVAGTIKGNIDISFNDLDINGNLYVGGDASFNQNVDISGNLNVLGNSYVGEQFFLNSVQFQDASGTLIIFANLEVFNLSVLENVFFSQNVDISSNLNVVGYASFNQNVDISSNLNVLGDTSFNQNVDISGNLTTNQDCTINGLIIGRGGGNKNTNSAFGTSSLYSNSNGNLNTAIGYYSMESYVTGSYNTAIGAESANQSNGGSYNTFLGYNTSLNDIYNNSTALGYNATITDSNQIVLGTSSEYVYIPSIKTSTGQNTGALVVSGDAYINNNLIVAGTIKGNIDISFNDLNVSGNLYVGGDASFNQNVDILGDLNVTGAIKGNLDISFNDLDINGNLYVGGDASFNQNVDILGKLNVVSEAKFNQNLHVNNITSENDCDINSVTIGTGPYPYTGNTILGQNALQTGVVGSVSGGSNTSIGYSSGTISNNVILSNNTFIGANTNVIGYGISNSTALGYQATITASNQIVLGTANEYVYIPSTTAGSASAGALLVEGGICAIDNMYAKSFNQTSDYRLKENIVSLFETDYSIDFLKPVTYDLKKDENKTQHIGFIAHELQKSLPFLVNGEKDGPDTQSINYTGLIGLLVKEVQDLKKRVSELEKQNL